MENSCQKESKYIRHFTDVDALFKILEGGLRFSKPSTKWDDENDLYCVNKYAELIGKDVYVLCFCAGIGNIHDWTYFGSSIISNTCAYCYKTIKCNIKLNRAKVEKALKEQGFRQLEPMIYCTTKRLKENFNNKHQLPYLKRNEYCIEQELRSIIECEKGIINSPSLIIPLECIEGINILIDKNSKKVYNSIKKELESRYPHLKGKIDFNGSMDSRRWKTEVNKIINNKEITDI